MSAFAQSEELARLGAQLCEDLHDAECALARINALLGRRGQATVVLENGHLVFQVQASGTGKGALERLPLGLCHAAGRILDAPGQIFKDRL